MWPNYPTTWCMIWRGAFESGPFDSYTCFDESIDLKGSMIGRDDLPRVTILLDSLMLFLRIYCYISLSDRGLHFLPVLSILQQPPHFTSLTFIQSCLPSFEFNYRQSSCLILLQSIFRVHYRQSPCLILLPIYLQHHFSLIPQNRP